MAIYHLAVQIIKRSAGRSATAAAAYRAHEKIEDERTGLTHDYTRRRGEVEAFILAPDQAPDWAHDRAALWNEAEAAEKRKDAQVAREINVALPVELTPAQQRDLIERYAKNLYVADGMIADVAIHRDHEENPHAHIMLTTREITAEGFGQKNRTWNDKELLEEWRHGWEVMANHDLERAGHDERIDSRTLEAQGIDRMPTIHEGPAVRQMEQRGIKTDRGNLNRLAKEHARISAEEKTLVYDIEKYRNEKEELQKELGAKPEPTPKIAPQASTQPRELSAAIGTLVSHGAAHYKNDPENKMSYFVTLKAKGGEKIIWGVDLERAIEESRVEIGKRIRIDNVGYRQVEVQAPVRDQNGNITGEKTIQSNRKTWEIREALPDERITRTPAQLNEMRQQAEKCLDLYRQLDSLNKAKAHKVTEIQAWNHQGLIARLRSKEQLATLEKELAQIDEKINSVVQNLPTEDRETLSEQKLNIDQKMDVLSSGLKAIDQLLRASDQDLGIEPSVPKKKKQKHEQEHGRDRGMSR